MKIGDDCSLWFVPSVIAGDVGLSRKIQSKLAEKVYLLLNKEKFSLKKKTNSIFVISDFTWWKWFVIWSDFGSGIVF